MWKRMAAKAEGVYIADTESFVTKQMDKLDFDYGGIPGDLHFGLTKKAGAREPMFSRGTEIFNRRQISIVSIEECDEIALKMGVPSILPEWLGANVAVSGIPDLTSLKEGSRLIFQAEPLCCVREKMIRVFSREKSFSLIIRTSRSWPRLLSATHWA